MIVSGMTASMIGLCRGLFRLFFVVAPAAIVGMVGRIMAHGDCFILRMSGWLGGRFVIGLVVPASATTVPAMAVLSIMAVMHKEVRERARQKDQERQIRADIMPMKDGEVKKPAAQEADAQHPPRLFPPGSVAGACVVRVHTQVNALARLIP